METILGREELVDGPADTGITYFLKYLLTLGGKAGSAKTFILITFCARGLLGNMQRLVEIDCPLLDFKGTVKKKGKKEAVWRSGAVSFLIN